MKIMIDMDGVICENTRPMRECKMLPGAKERINSWYDQGHRIIIFTSRFKCDRKITREYLKEKGVKYHKLILNKPQCDIYIGDEAWRFEGWDKLPQNDELLQV